MSSSFGGIGSSASSTTQLSAAAATLQAFDRPISVAVIEQFQDWETRQHIAYAAILKYLKEDFLSLQDWVDQITSYSRSNPKELSGPLGSIASRIGLNSRLQSHLTYINGLGMVGIFLEDFDSFAKVFTLSAAITSNQKDMAQQLGVTD